MKIEADREVLRDVLTRAYRGAGKQNSFPALQGLLCEANGDELTVTGTDFDITVQTNAEVDVSEDGSALISGSLLTRGITYMPRGKIVIQKEKSEEDDSFEVVITGESESKGNKQPRYSFYPLKQEDFPEIEAKDLDRTEVSGKDLCDAIDQVVVAASNDQARPILTGVLFEPLEKKGIRLVATDSYRLALRDLPGVGLKLSEDGLLPARGLKELRPTISAEKIDVGVDEKEAIFSSERGSLRVRLIEGTFPRYKSLLPESHPIVAEINRDSLLSAINRVKLIAEEHIPVRLNFYADKVEISANRQGIGGGSEELDCSCVYNPVSTDEDGDQEGSDDSKETKPVPADEDGPIVSIAFNPTYLADGVRSVGDNHQTVRMQMIDGFKPSVIDGGEGSEFLYLLMPVRV